MEKKLTLERFQREVFSTKMVAHKNIFFLSLKHPGFDFSGADISGQYSGGGPRLD